MNRRPEISEAEIRSLFEAQDPKARFSQAQLTGALPPSKVLFESFGSGPAVTRPGPHPMRRRVVVVAIAVLLLALLTAAAWIYIATKPSSAPLMTLCYRSLGVDSPSVEVGINPGESADQACVRQWEANFHAAAPQILVTCIVEEGGATGVFPNPDDLDARGACGLIGGALPQEAALYGGISQDQVRALNADLVSRAEENSVKGCTGAADLAAQAQGALDMAGATEWTIDDQTSPTQHWIFADGTRAIVEVPTDASGQTCADFAVNALQAKVVLSNAWQHPPAEPPSLDPQR